MDPIDESTQRADATLKAMGPWKALIRPLGCLLPFLALFFLMSGRVLEAALAAVTFVAVVLGFGSWLMRQGGADPVQRTMFRMTLMTTRGAKGRLFAALKYLLAPYTLLLTLYSWDWGFVLASLKGPKAEPWIIGKLASGQEFERWKAAVLLKDVGSVQCLPAIRHALAAESVAEVRIALLRTLTVLDPEHSFQEARSIVEYSEDDVEWLIGAAFLCRVGQPPIITRWRIERLKNVMLTIDVLDRNDFGADLGALPFEESGDLVRSYLGLGEGWLELLAELGQQRTATVRDLLSELLSKDDLTEHQLCAVLNSIGKSADPSFLIPLRERLSTNASRSAQLFGEMAIRELESLQQLQGPEQP
ncbi:MAG: hypothetical protein K1X67_06650 [Fimbriimonadaceae bacterium]|nr:hypothetical protein [Fimbriimonadaceae bacterium]